MHNGSAESDPIVVTLTCQLCGENFPFSPQSYSTLGLKDLPKRCPSCLDKRQERPEEAVVLSRHCLHLFPAVAIHLPVEWFAPFQARADDRPCLRAVVKGNSLTGFAGGGVSWEGRLDIFCPGQSSLPSIVCVRVMEVTHAAGHRRVERKKDSDRAVPEVPLNHPGHPVVEVEVVYPATFTYLALEPSEEVTPTTALTYLSVDYKTTLKGFGRQWYASLDASGALWAARFSRSARSGRFGVYGAVAVVDDDHPVIIGQTGDIASRRLFNLSNPSGLDI